MSKLTWPCDGISDSCSMSLEITEDLIARQSPEARAIIRALLAQREVMAAEIQELREEVRRLRDKDGTGPGMQATDDRQKSTGRKKTKSETKRKRGGQAGHVKRERPLISTEKCDEVVPLWPDACRRCGGTLAECDLEPLRHQVHELPEIKLHVTEYQQHRGHCPCCGITTCAPLRDGVPTGQSGPRLVMFVALLMAMFRQSKRRVSLFCETLLDHHMSPGLVVKLQNQATESLRPCYDELVAAIPRERVVYADETGTWQQNENAWIWTTVCSTFTVFTIRLTKAACVIKSLLTDDFKGVVVSDRAKTYDWVPWHQWCWAHLQRDFETMSDRDGAAGHIGQRLLDATHKLFHYCRRIRDGDITERGFHRQISILRGEVESALAAGCDCADSATAGTCRELWNGFDNLWVFQYHRAVEPTNNSAERSLRHAVIWKHLSFGTQSEAGSRFVETFLTVIETCRQQSRDTFLFLCESHQRVLNKQNPLSLINTP